MFSRIQSDTVIQRTQRDPVAWRPAGVLIHAIKDVIYPYDSRVVKAIRREFDSAIIPVTVLRAYRAQTGGLEVYRFPAIASHQPQKLRIPEWSQRVLLPVRGKAVPRPTHMDLHLEDRTTRKGDGLPGRMYCFDWRVYHTLRALYQEYSSWEAAAFLAKADERREKRLEEANRRTAYIYNQDRRWLREKVENIITAPPRELRKALAERARRRQAMVFVKGVAP